MQEMNTWTYKGGNTANTLTEVVCVRPAPNCLCRNNDTQVYGRIPACESEYESSLAYRTKAHEFTEKSEFKLELLVLLKLGCH